MATAAQTVHSLFPAHELVLEKEWLEIRDAFFGENCFNQDITRALELAAACEHNEARWLTRVFAGKTVSTKEEARDVFLALGENDARGLCFAALLLNNEDDDYEEERRVALLRRSAELGCALAQGMMAEQTEGEDGFRLATFAASQRERVGFFWLGHYFQDGDDDCDENVEKARENFLIAAELGDVYAMTRGGLCFEESDPLRWFWLGQVANRGVADDFVFSFAEQVQQFELGSGNAAAVFQIGKVLNGHVNLEERTIFGDDDDFDSFISPANFAISFYKAQLAACRHAVDAWSLCCIRLNIYSNLRVLMGKMIWKSRDLALFDVAEDMSLAEPDLKSSRTGQK